MDKLGLLYLNQVLVLDNLKAVDKFEDSLPIEELAPSRTDGFFVSTLVSLSNRFKVFELTDDACVLGKLSNKSPHKLGQASRLV